MDGLDDSPLWERSLAGDGAAFAQIFDRHHPRVHRHAHRLTADQHYAEDLSAGAFLELWRRRHDAHLVSGSLLPWLLVTTSNLARNHARGLRRYRAFLERLPRGDLTAPEPTATSAGTGTWSDLDGPWARALARLSAADLRLVTLVVMEEHSLADAGALLGLSPQATKSRMHRARQRLRAALAADGSERPTATPTTPAAIAPGAPARTPGGGL